MEFKPHTLLTFRAGAADAGAEVAATLEQIRVDAMRELETSLLASGLHDVEQIDDALAFVARDAHGGDDR